MVPAAAVIRNACHAPHSIVDLPYSMQQSRIEPMMTAESVSVVMILIPCQSCGLLSKGSLKRFSKSAWPWLQYFAVLKENRLAIGICTGADVSEDGIKNQQT